MADLNAVNKIETLEVFPPIVCFWGSSDYLLLKTQILMKSKCGAFPDTEATVYDADDLRSSDPETLFMQDSFFGQKNFVLFARAELSEKFWAPFLAELTNPKNLSVYLCLFYKGGKLPEKIKKNLQKLNAQMVHCVEPDNREILSFIAGLGKKYGLNIGFDSQQLIHQVIGNNLSVLENEIKRLGFIFADDKRMIFPKELSEHLGLLKEEMVFKLQNYLTKRQTERAELFVTDLLARGESEFALIGIIAKHCRTILKITENPQISMAQLGVRNPYQYNDYKSMAQIRGYHHKVADALNLCAHADKLLKSTRISERFVLTDILSSLS